MRRGVLSAAWLGLAMAITTSDAPAGGQKGGGPKANDGVVTNWGKPKGFGPGKVTAYWVWHEDGVWHFRTTGGGKGAHRFNGTIEVIGGQLVGLNGKKGEYAGKYVDRYVFNKTLTAIAFDFRTDEGVDGLNFAVDPAATGLRFTLAIDGEAHPKHIRVGKAGDHPAKAMFVAPAHPADPPDAKGKKKK
jgi:hypothetical protein